MGPAITFVDCHSCPITQRATFSADERKVLIRFPHGLGDAVAFTTVLAHLQKNFPYWQIDIACHPSLHSLFHRLAFNVLTIEEASRADYATYYDMPWHEGHRLFPRIAPTKVARCLLEIFHVLPDPDLLQYRFEPSQEAKEIAVQFIGRLPKGKKIAIHYEGTACRDSKDIPIEVVAELCSKLIFAGDVPILLDWSEKPRLADGHTTFCVGRGHWLWQGKDHADADTLAALLRATDLNIMIDSGPQKLALTGGPRLLAIWSKTNPMHVIDLPNGEDHCLHLVPEDWEKYLTQSNGVSRDADQELAKQFFLANYRHETYTSLAEKLALTAQRLLETPEDAFDDVPLHVPIQITPEALSIPKSNKRKILLQGGPCPGDTMTLTAAVKCLHEQFPGQFLTAVETSCPAIWEENPDIVAAEPDFERIEAHYHLIQESGNRPVHFIQGYTEHLAKVLGIPLRLTTNRPHLYLSQQEKDWMNQVWEVTKNPSPYWIINAGVKHDYTAKQYPWFQEVVDLLRGKVRFAQIGKSSDLHTPLNGVVNLIDKTSDRALIRLIYHAQGILSGVSFPMHLAAAFEKSAVIIAGGREPRLWNSYPTQSLLCTVGALDCCRTGGCWRSRVVPLGDDKDGKTCEHPMPTDLPAGECMTRIKPETVAATIESYLP